MRSKQSLEFIKKLSSVEENQFLSRKGWKSAISWIDAEKELTDRLELTYRLGLADRLGLALRDFVQFSILGAILTSIEIVMPLL